MDINKIFGTFNSKDEDKASFPSPHFIDDNHPRYFIRLFVKLLTNYPTYMKQTLGVLRHSGTTMDLDELKTAADILLYNKAYECIVQVDVQDKYHIKVLFEEADDDLKVSLNKILNFFEKGEGYEKCANIKKYLDFLNFSS